MKLLLVTLVVVTSLMSFPVASAQDLGLTVGAMSQNLTSAGQQEVGNKATGWLETQQQDDGGFGSPASSPGVTCDAVMALAAAGENSDAFLRNGTSPLDYLGTHVISATQSVGGTAKLVLAVVAAGQSPDSFAGKDLWEILNGQYDSANGHFGKDGTGHMWAMLSLKGAGEPIPDAAVAWLKGVQIEDGSWDWGGTTAGPGDTNDTALALQALAAAGEPKDSPVVTKALGYLLGQQNDDAGFPYVTPSQYGTESDANSTANVIQGLLAVGQDLAEWSKGDAKVMDLLVSLQNPSGAFRWKADVPQDNLLATVQAIPAVLNQPLPVAAPPAATAPVLSRTGESPVSVLFVLGLVLVLVGLGLTRLRWPVRRG